MWKQQREALSVLVHRCSGRDGWFLSCYRLEIDSENLEEHDFVAAKLKAVKLVQDTARKLALCAEALDPGIDSERV